MTRPPLPVGPHEVAAMLNVTRQRVTQLRQQSDFPEPWVLLASTPVWRDTDIEEYARRKGRTVNSRHAQ